MDTALVNDSNAPHALFSNRVLDELFSLPLYIDRSSCSHIALLSSWTLPAQLSQAKTQVNVVGVETMRLATATSELVNFFVHAVLSSSGQQKVHRWLPHPWYHMTLTRALRVSYIASVAFMHICSNKIFDKCQFYQQSRVLFPDHNIVYRELGMLSKRLKVPSNKLHIVSGGKGMVAGFLSFTDCTKVAINVSSFLPGPYFIPQTPELLTNVNTHGRNGILLVEGETAFHVILNHPNVSRILKSYIIVHGKTTSKQCPDVRTANFIRKLGKVQKKKRNEKLKVYTLTNADPHSVIVARNYQLALKTECDVSWLSYKLWKMRGSLKLAAQNMVKLSENERRDAKLNAKRWSKATRTRTALKLIPLAKTMNEMIRYNEKFSLLSLSSSRQIGEKGRRLGLFEYVAQVLPDC